MICTLYIRMEETTRLEVPKLADRTCKESGGKKAADRILISEECQNGFQVNYIGLELVPGGDCQGQLSEQRLWERHGNCWSLLSLLRLN